MTPSDHDLLVGLVDWWDTIRGSRPWRMREPLAWISLVESGLVARAPEGHVYPLPHAIQHVHRRRTKKESP